jgi:segregation and condensation protein B
MTSPFPGDGTEPGWTVDVPTEIDAIPEEPIAPPRKVAESRTTEEPEEPPPLPRLLEALFFAGGPPLTVDRVAEVIRGLTQDDYQELIDGLNRDYRRQNRPYRIVAVEGGHALLPQPRYRDVLQRLNGAVRETRLSPAALDTLAVVAYKEPLSAEEVDSVRGADSSAPLRQLVRLGLIALERVAGDSPTVVYRTTGKFLDLFGLQSRDDLPRTQNPQEM